MEENSLQKVIITKDNLSEHLESLLLISKKFWQFYLDEEYCKQYEPKQVEGVDFGYMKEEIENEECFCEIVYKDEMPVAFLIGLFEDNSLFYELAKFGMLDELFVDESVRGSGIGKELVKDFTEHCEAKNISIVTLNARFKNKKAIDFYEYLGFEIDKVRMFKKI